MGEMEMDRMDKDRDLLGLEARLKRWFWQDLAVAQKWREEAREDFAFYNGKQWSDEDLAQMRSQRRPVMTFNRIAPMVNAVIGAEVNNRREVRYIPREVGDSVANELLTGAGEWFRDRAGAGDEETAAFIDTVIAGMGWVDTRIDFEEDPDGAPKVERLDPFKMVWDGAACKTNLTDARRVWYVDEKPLEDVRGLFPDMEDGELNAGWVRTGVGASDGGVHDNDRETVYAGLQDGLDGEGGRADDELCTIVECRWLERESYFRGQDLATGQMREYTRGELDDILAVMPDFAFVKQTRKVVRRAFLGRGLLGEPDKPLVPRGSFGWECITGYRDMAGGRFYGLVRPAKDPQRWSNKFFAQVMYLLNAQSKGGIMAERGAFDDDKQAESSLARADAITWVKNGALAGGAGRIQPKPVAQFPNGFFALFNEAKDALTQVTGLSAEFIGTREVDQAGVLEAQRRQSSLNLLAGLFNALRLYRKRQGEVVLYLIQNHLSDGRLIRIVGQDKSQYVPLTRDAIAHIDYDIIVDDAPTSPNEKERTFAILQQMLPLLMDYITPEIGLELLRYTPLPASMVDKFIEQARAAQEQAQAAQMQGQVQGQVPDPAQMEAERLAQKHALEMESQGVKLYANQVKAQTEAEIAVMKAGLQQQRLAAMERENQIRAARAGTVRGRI